MGEGEGERARVSEGAGGEGEIQTCPDHTWEKLPQRAGGGGAEKGTVFGRTERPGEPVCRCVVGYVQVYLAHEKPPPRRTLQ